MIYLVIKCGVYDQGVAFASTDRAAAMEFMRSHKPDQDGYHQWDLREMPMDKVNPDLPSVSITA